MNLRTIPELARRFAVPAGLSDHTLGIAVAVAAVTLGACIIEKHITLSRSLKGPDSEFSLEPQEFKAMVEAIRTTERALGAVHFGASAQEASSLVFRRSLFVVQDLRRGEEFTARNVRSIRPASWTAYPPSSTGAGEARFAGHSPRHATRLGFSRESMRVVSPLLKHAVFPGLAKLGYLRRRNGAGPAIVTYHGIFPQGYKMIDPDLDGSLVSADSFRRQLRSAEESLQRDFSAAVSRLV